MNWLAVLREVGAHNKTGVTARYLATRLEQPLSTIYRWIEFLMEADLLVRHPSTKKLHLGAVAGEIGAAAIAAPYVDPQVEAALTQLARRLGARVHLVMRHHDYSVALRTAHSDQSASTRTMVAKMRLLGIGPGAICLLGEFSEPEVRRFYVRNKEELCAAGLDEDILLSKVRYMWTNGCSISHGALTQGWSAIGVPFVHEGSSMAVSVALPSEAFELSLSQLKPELLTFSDSFKT